MVWQSITFFTNIATNQFIDHHKKSLVFFYIIYL